MVQPVSATVIWAASSARAAGDGASAIAVTRSREPGPCGAATATGTSAVRWLPGSGTSTVAGRGVLTPGPSTRTVTSPPRRAGAVTRQRHPDHLQRAPDGPGEQVGRGDIADPHALIVPWSRPEALGLRRSSGAASMASGSAAKPPVPGALPPVPSARPGGA